ncbi:MAG: carbohydrate kinase [Boseongicola sp.]|nr:MAG: carbohydrate kinase [Boseongicola sp.]
MSDQKIIAIGGENLIDRVQTGAQDGQTTFANNPGGSPFNVAMAVARQDGVAHYLTPISTDDMGDLLAERLINSGVHIAAPRRDEPTSLAIVTLNNGIPDYEFRRTGTAERCVTEASIAAAQPPGTAVFHIGSLALIEGDDARAWEAAANTASANGQMVSLDPNVRTSLIHDHENYRARLMRLFHTADLVKLSDEDLEYFYPDTPLQSAWESLCNTSPAALIVLTKGPDGAQAYNGDHHVSIAAPKVPDLKDTIGAGDTFMGTLLATLTASDTLTKDKLKGLDDAMLKTLLTRAAQAAALNCAQEGCNPPTLTELDAALV